MERQTFAFKLAARRPSDTGKWQARDGVALAGCSLYGQHYRQMWRIEIDNGPFC